MITKRETKTLIQEKLQPVVADLLREARSRYFQNEMAARCNLGENRISEYIKQTRKLTEKSLIQLIGGGIVKTSELKKRADLNDGEAQYLDSLAIYENEGLKHELRLYSEAGLDPVKALRSYREISVKK